MDSYLSRQCLKILFIFLVCVLVVIVFYHAFGPVKGVSQCSHFSVVLDCGSTGTRVSVYEWVKDCTNSKDLPILLRSLPDHSSNRALQQLDCKYHCMQTEPGLHKLVQNESGISSALEPLLVWAEHQIPSQRLKETPVIVLATAGLRQLSRADADWVLENAEATLKRHQFIYRTIWIRVLSGKEESYYGWVALNYKLNKLEYSLSEPTLGVLDLGGSSLQVVMEVAKSREDKHFLTSKIGSVEHQLLAYSLPAFGLNAAFERSILMLTKEQPDRVNTNGKLEVHHPCISSGFTQNYTCYDCYTMPNASNAQNISSQSTTFYLVGDPDWEQCHILSRAAAIHSDSLDWLQLMDDLNCKSRSSSSFGTEGTEEFNKTTPRLVTHFHALSGFFAIYSMLNLDSQANVTELLERGQELCSRSWEELKRMYSTRYYLEQSCFRAPYLASLIEEGLCLGDAEIIFGPGDVSWTLGAALVEDEYLWSNKNEYPGWNFGLRLMEVMLSSSFVFALFICLIFIAYYWKYMCAKTQSMPASGKKGAAVGISLPSYIYPKRQFN